MSDDALTPGLLRRLPSPAKKAVILRASTLGDFLCAGPAFRSLRTALPGAEITVISLAEHRSLGERLPWFDRFVPFPGYPGLVDECFDPHRALDFFTTMQEESFDLAIQLQGPAASANPFILMLGARRSAGFIRPGDGPGRLDAALPLPGQGHEVRRALALPLFLGAEFQGERIEFPLCPADHEAASALVGQLPRPLIGIHPGGRDPERHWPVSHYATVGAALVKRHGATVALLGDQGAKSANEALCRSIGASCVDLTGATGIGTLGAVIARLDLLITNDSGPAHIAYALGTPTVTVFRNEETARYGPPSSGPFLALLRENGYEVTAQEALEAAEELMGETAGQEPREWQTVG